MDQTIGSLIDTALAWIAAEEWRIGLALVIVVSVLGSAIAARMGRRQGRAGASACRWEHVGRDGGFDKWSCRTCGAGAYLTKGKPVKGCRGGLAGF